MILYKVGNNNTISQIKEKPFKLEKEIQKLFEDNLDTIMNLEFVKTEFQIKDKRIDTLAFDPQTNAFVIIEYKRDRKFGVSDQGLAYLGLMLQNKADFILAYYEQLKTRNLQIDWSQSRVVFVTTDFSEYQLSMNHYFKDLPIELWTIKMFDNNTIAITQIDRSKTATSFKLLKPRSKEVEEIMQEIKVYTEDDALNGKPDNIIELYSRFRFAILNLVEGIEVKPQKQYIAFKKNNKNITDIEIQKSKLKIFINVKTGKIDDPKHLARDVSKIGHWGNGDYEVVVSDTKNLEYILSLIKQTPNIE